MLYYFDNKVAVVLVGTTTVATRFDFLILENGFKLRQISYFMSTGGDEISHLISHHLRNRFTSLETN